MWFSGLMQWDPPTVLACRIGDLDRLWREVLYPRAYPGE